MKHRSQYDEILVFIKDKCLDEHEMFNVNNVNEELPEELAVFLPDALNFFLGRGQIESSMREWESRKFYYLNEPQSV